MRRLSVAGLMGVVGVIAGGMAAVRLASPLVLDLVAGVILLALAVGLLGVVVGAKPREGWRGFALFGWGYFLYLALPWPTLGGLHVVPTDRVVQRVVSGLQSHPVQPSRPSFPSPYDPVTYVGKNDQEVLSWPTRTGNYVPLTPAEVKAWNEYKDATSAYESRKGALNQRAQDASHVCHLELALALALIGWATGQFFSRIRHATATNASADPIDDPRHPDRYP